MDLKTISTNNRASLRSFLESRFSLAELKNLAFDLGICYESLDHSTIPDLARTLILHCERISILGCLILAILERRYDATFAKSFTPIPLCEIRSRVIVILPQDVIQSGATNIQNALAILAGVKPEDIEIIAARRGSLQLLISLPKFGAEQLIKSISACRFLAVQPILDIAQFNKLTENRQESWRLAEGINSYLQSNVIDIDIYTLISNLAETNNSINNTEWVVDFEAFVRRLSDRDRELLKNLMLGLGTEQISKLMNLSIKTILNLRAILGTKIRAFIYSLEGYSDEESVKITDYILRTPSIR